MKDVDFSRAVIVVREGKGAKDRVVMLPPSLVGGLQEHLAVIHGTWQADTAANQAGMIYTHVLKIAAGGTTSPLDTLAPIMA